MLTILRISYEHFQFKQSTYKYTTCEDHISKDEVVTQNHTTSVKMLTISKY